MLSHFIKRFQMLFQQIKGQEHETPVESQQKNSIPIKKSYQKNLEDIKNALDTNFDLVIREFNVQGHENRKAFIAYLSKIVNEEKINDNIVKPLMEPMERYESLQNLDLSYIKNSILPTVNVEQVSDLNQIIENIVNGETALFYMNYGEALSIDSWEVKGRDIEKPETETVVRGPKESFNESLSENTALLRRKIKNPDLKLESFTLGNQTKTEVIVAYMEDIADENIVNEVKSRLSEIDIDAILESGYVEEFLEDAPYSPFPTVGNTEKPDKLAADLLDGRIGLMFDGTPIALYVPYLFVETFMTSEDYYTRYSYASFLRGIRIIALLVTVMLPGFYVSVVSFHPELIPKELAVSIAVASEGVPFPTFLEILFFGVIFEILREAGIRMPSNVGQAVSIVGALILGEAAIQAGIVGAPVVIVTALTAISGFAVPTQLDALTMLRIPFVFASAIMGLPGLLTAFNFIIIYLCSLRSFSVPYFSPVAPLSLSGLKDFMVRVPWWLMFKRPKLISEKNKKRQPFGQRPKPEQNND
ncbi:spore germination protein [Natranaerobius thermophilus]|uniref:GerA spore germination protein n=1 Tax=Natranaerobius thermophilus (strain ATCC BAA-1301 / DSM 18059 / JW/NM-WN-LF) TaxID=457570 RepID=B2A895_NATTJ|nr:spore germination protein [Natranaerobius thermophilus]ACB84461.1 GerA spore germination protein [Natranaerobius thermophilus JW/NM-WN-LF]